MMAGGIGSGRLTDKGIKAFVAKAEPGKKLADEWFALKKKEWSASHHSKSVRAFERDIYPLLANLPISSITPAIAAKVIEDVYGRGVLETASRLLQHLNGVFRYAQAKGLCRDNPACTNYLLNSIFHRIIKVMASNDHNRH